MNYFLDTNNGNAPPGFDTDHLHDENNDNDDLQNPDDLNDNSHQQQWNASGNNNYNLIGQRLMQLAQEGIASSNNTNNNPPSTPPASNFIRPLMQLTPNRLPPPPPPRHAFFNQNAPNQMYPSPSMFRPRGGGGRGGNRMPFRGGRGGFTNYRGGGGGGFRGGPRGRW